MTATSLHFAVQNISRGGGKKATAAAAYRTGSRLRHQPSTVARAAYRSGESLRDAKLGRTFDFRRKERVDYTHLHVHQHRPAWAVEREAVWNGIESIERRKDARLAKDITAALPRTLTLEQHIALVEEFVTREFVSRGLIADIAIHNKKARDGGENPHVHIMITTRRITPEGFGKKDRELDKQETLERWRKSYEEICNRHLEEAGSEQRVSLKSFKERGIDQIPQVRVDHEAWRMEQQGVQTEQGDINRDIQHVNNLRGVMHRSGLDVEAPPDLVARIEEHNKPRRRGSAASHAYAQKFTCCLGRTDL
ncbi:MAG: MobQ family relaxase [Caldilineaceae bacterium]